MTQPAYVSRADALAFIVEQRSREIIQLAAQTSVAMRTFRQIQMGSSSLKTAVLERWPEAQWLTPTMSAPLAPPDVDAAIKPTTDMGWGVKELFAEEAAAIVIIPENVIDDAEIDLWSEIESRTAEAIARLIDMTVFFGDAPVGGVPTTFPVGGIYGEAVAAGHLVTPPATYPAGEDLATSWNETMSLVEADGFDVSAAYCDRGIRGQLRGLRDANGTPLYVTNLAQGGPVDAMYGVPLYYVTNGAWDSTKAQAIMGDPKMAILGIRQRLTAKRLTEATIGTGASQINLAERDLVALRVKTRLGFAVIIPKGPGQSANPYPFAVLGPKASA